MSAERTIRRLVAQKLPKGVRWLYGGPIEATVANRRVIVGVLTHDNISPRSRRAFAEIHVGLKAEHGEMTKVIDAGVAELLERSRI